MGVDVLGVIRVGVEGRSIDIAAAKERTVLARLAVAPGQPVTPVGAP